MLKAGKWIILLLLFGASSGSVLAQGIDPVPNPPDADDEYSESPYTKYGNFDEDEAEAEASRFFQYGRFFGLSLGAGFSGIIGNRGLLYQGGFPLIDIRIHYWFNFNFALDLQFTNVGFQYEDTTLATATTVDVSIFYIGVDLKYYIGTQDLSAPITFANPYLLIGAGNFSKSEAAFSDPAPSTDSQFGFGAGFGLELLISPKSSYFYLEGRLNIVNFDDRFSTTFAGQGVPDLTGFFYSVSAGILFTY